MGRRRRRADVRVLASTIASIAAATPARRATGVACMSDLDAGGVINGQDLAFVLENGNSK